MISSIAARSRMPLSISTDSKASTRSSIGVVGSGWWWPSSIVALQVALPQVHVDQVAALAPHLGRLEAHAVGGLEADAVAVVFDVGQRRHLVETRHRPPLALDVARGPGVAERVPL